MGPLRVAFAGAACEGALFEFANKELVRYEKVDMTTNRLYKAQTAASGRTPPRRWLTRGGSASSSCPSWGC